MGNQRGKRGLGGMLRLSQVVLAGFLVLGCDGGVTADAQVPAVGRPEGVSGGPRVGVVVLASPDVRVQPSRGSEFAAKQGVMLVRDDTLVTTADPKSFVVVELYNGHLVRFNHESKIVVEKIAVFDAGRAGDDLAQRFEKVLRPEELKNEEMRGAISRVAGWNSRMTASETIAALPASQLASPPPPPVESKSEASTRGDVPGAPEPGPVDPQADAPLADRAPEPSRPGDPKKASKRAEPGDGVDEPQKNSKLPQAPEDKDDDGAPGGGDVDSKQPTKKDKASGTEPEPESPKVDEKAPDLPGKVSFTPEGGTKSTIDLPLALSLERAQLARCAGRGALLRAKVVKGLIKEITVDGGKKCSLETSRALTLADGWLEMRVK